MLVVRPALGSMAETSHFGFSVALSGDTLVVGRPKHNPRVPGNSCYNCGAVYIFTRSGSTWSLQKEISKTSTVTGFTASTLNSGDYFG